MEIFNSFLYVYQRVGRDANGRISSTDFQLLFLLPG